MTKTVEEVLQAIKLPFELAPLQLEEIQELAKADRVGFFWEVGCGKTVGATIWALTRDTPQYVVLIPPILGRQWFKWLKGVLPEGSTVELYYGKKRSVEQLKAQWVITSHSIFRKDYPKIVREMLGSNYTVLLDEAQSAKNISSKLYKYTKQFAAGQPLALATATPTTTPADAYAYIELKTPEVYRSFAHFDALHVVSRDIFDRVEEWRDLEVVADHLWVNASKLTKEKAFKDSVKPPVYVPMEYELDPAHQKLYEQLVDECLLEYEDGTKLDASTPQRLHHLTQQMVLNYGLFSGNPQNVSRGLELIEEVIEETACMDPSRSKLLIWLWYQNSFRTVGAHLEKLFPGAIQLAYGGSNAQRAVRLFEEDPNCRLMVAHPKSVGVGFNAHFVCSEALLLEYSATPMDTRQSCGRIDRVGQTRIPNIRLACAAGTIQAKVAASLLENDDTVSKIELNHKTLRDYLLGR